MGVRNHKIVKFNSIGSQPARLLWADAQTKSSTGEQGQSAETFELRPHTEFKDLKTYKEHLKEAINQKLLSEEDQIKRLTKAETYFATAQEEKQEETGSKITKAIEKAKKEKKTEKIAKTALELINENHIKKLAELRNYVRQELKELGIYLGKESESLKEFIQFEQGVMVRVENLLDKNKHTNILAEIQQEKLLAKRCWERIKSLFSDAQKATFMRLLRLKEIPLGIEDEGLSMRGSIEEIFAARHNPLWETSQALVGTYGKDLFILDQALTAVENLHKHWQSAQAEDKSRLQWRLDQHEKELGKLKFEAEEASTSSANIDFRLFLENWNKFHQHRSSDLGNLRRLLASKEIDQDADTRKLVSAFLNGGDEQVRELKNDFARIREAKEAAAAAEAASKARAEAKKPKKTGKPKTVHEEEAPIQAAEKSEAGKKDIFGLIGDTYLKVMTVNGKVQWYSYHDIVESLKLFHESWKKHNESISEDKRGPLAKGLAFWHARLSQRINHEDVQAERGRAEDLMKTFKNYNYDELMARLADMPAKDNRRAILQTLADRGNLRMSDRRLINLICPGRFTEANWRFAESKPDFSAMREAFKHSIDNNFIGEFNYGNELLERHNAGFTKSEDAGKRYASSQEAGSTFAEVGIFDKERHRTQMQGEGVMSGMLSEMVERANTFSGNGGWSTVEIKIDGQEINVTRNSDMGLIGLLITDAYLRGKLSREFISKVGKGHEQVFRPFACIQDDLAAREFTDPVTGEKISKFEYWGWIDEKKGTVTALGATQLIRFFNTRNAKASIKQEDGNRRDAVVHQANIKDGRLTWDCNRITSIRDARNGVGDKFIGYVTKAASIDIFDQATQNRSDTGASVSEIREISAMLKAGVEEFIDGAQISVDHPDEERYIDRFTGKELDPATRKPLDDERRPIADAAPIPRERWVAIGQTRMERGKEILTRILYNMWFYREDRDILREQQVFKIFGDNDLDNGVPTKTTTKEGGTLRDFLTKSLGKWSGTSEYREVLAALERLEDPNQKLGRSEIDAARNFQKSQIRSREDVVQQIQRRGGRQKLEPSSGSIF